MTRRQHILLGTLAWGLLTGASATAQIDTEPQIFTQCTVLTDPMGDAAFRHPYSYSEDGTPVQLPTQGMLPDIASLTLCGWAPTDATNLYSGQRVDGLNADFFKLDLVLNGLFNPPGVLGFAPIGGFSPYEFGSRPVYGYVELNMDRSIQTGGHATADTKPRYLANAARFGALPSGLLSTRAARWGHEVDDDCSTEPLIERSGSEFTLTLCGCDPVTVVDRVVDLNSTTRTFDAGETWIVRSRFFKLASAFTEVGPFFSGSDLGTYDPEVQLRFQHNIDTDRTTITLVYPLTAEGAAFTNNDGTVVTNFDVSDDTFVLEALEGVIVGVNGNAPTQDICDSTDGWRGRTIDPQTLDPTRWAATAIVGTAATTGAINNLICPFIWTDVGFGHRPGDVNGDGIRNYIDRDVVRRVIRLQDGEAVDTDRLIDGKIELGATNYSVYDVNGNGIIDLTDANAIFIPCEADVDGNGVANVVDLLLFLSQWFAMHADLDASGSTDVLDLLAYMDLWFVGCA